MNIIPIASHLFVKFSKNKHFDFGEMFSPYSYPSWQTPCYIRREAVEAAVLGHAALDYIQSARQRAQAPGVSCLFIIKDLKRQ